MDGAAFSTVAQTSLTNAVVGCGGALSCDYRVVTTNLQGAGPPSNAVNLRTGPGQVQSLGALTQLSDPATGISQVALSFNVPTTGMPVDHYELARCTIAVGATTGCGTSGSPTTGNWSASDVVSGTFPEPVMLSETCSAGVATCYWRVRAVTVRGGALLWRSVNLQSWAPVTTVMPGPETGQITIRFVGPAESGPDGTAKFYTALVCSGNCANPASWTNSGLSIPYPPAGASPYTAGVVACGANSLCQVRMQFTDGRGAAGVASAAVSGRGAALMIATPLEGAFTMTRHHRFPVRARSVPVW